MSLAKLVDIFKKATDKTVQSLQTIDYAHHEVHEGSRFYVQYGVASLGALTSPDDMITLTFKTPNTLKWDHFIFLVTGSSGFRIRLIEAPTGGAATATGTIEIQNKNILIVDDVFTTGATVNSICKLLKKNNAAKIYVLTIARAL